MAAATSVNSSTPPPPLLSFQWASLEEARVELERAAGCRIQLIGGLSIPGTPPPHAVTLYTRPRKILGHMWVVAPRRMGAPQFQDSFIRLVEFVLGRLQREEQDTMRQDLMVSCVFHEIRNPLTGILNAVDLLLEGSSAVAHNLKLIETNVSYLLQVTTDLLELFRISQNRIACKSVPCAPRSLLAEVAALFPELRCVISVPESVPEFLTCDATKYKQILINLLSNSRKFKATEVTLRVAYRSVGDHHQLYTEIADNGPGVEAPAGSGEKTNLFKSLGKSTTGLGIGLFMCRKLAELMQGKISLKQNSPHGCTFALQFPVGVMGAETPTNTPASTATLPPVATTPKALRILIADDHTAVRDTLAQMLQGFPAVSFTDTAIDGQDAVEKFQKSPYDWIFLDLKMPRKSGWQAAQEILGFGGHRDNPPKIIFISAFALSATEKLASQRLGVRGFIQKPFRKADVVKIMNHGVAAASLTATNSLATPS